MSFRQSDSDTGPWGHNHCPATAKTLDPLAWYLRMQDLDRTGFLRDNPDVKVLLQHADTIHRLVRASYSDLERLLWKWGIVDTPLSDRRHIENVPEPRPEPVAVGQ